MLLLAVLAAIQVESDVYRFDQAVIEFWYRIPISGMITPADTAGMIAGTIYIPYEFELKIKNNETSDSNVISGSKKIPVLLPLPPDEQFSVEYMPFDLYPGRFDFNLKVWTMHDTGYCRQQIIVNEIEPRIAFSDLIIGRKDGNEIFEYRGLHFYPFTRNFSLFDTLLSFVEIYGMRPDSLQFIAKYAILDSANKMIFSTKYKRLKTDYHQFETLSVNLKNFVEGSYQIQVNINEPVSGAAFEQKRPFVIISRISDAFGKRFYRDIDLLISPKEFKKFFRLTPQEQELYLKNFWQRNDYWSFEDRILTADRLFTIHGLKGRNSQRGSYLVKYGEPEEREVIPMLQWSRQLELWHYYTLGKDVLFCDIKNDGNPAFITELDIGELVRILEMGIRDKDDLDKYPWLKEIAPGTYDQKTMDDIDQ